MRLCDECEDQQAAGSAASSCSRNKPRFHRHPPPADDDKQTSRVEFPAAVYLLMKQDRPRELIEFSSSLQPSVTKLVCVRTSSKGIVPSF